MECKIRERERTFPFATAYMSFVRCNNPAVKLVPVGLSKRVKRQQCEECPCNHGDGSERSFTSSPTDIFMTWCLNKRYILRERDDVCFTQ